MFHIDQWLSPHGAFHYFKLFREQDEIVMNKIFIQRYRNCFPVFGINHAAFRYISSMDMYIPKILPIVLTIIIIIVSNRK